MNLQDDLGNTHYHLAIKHNVNLDYLLEPNEIIAKKSDIDGNTILHLLLKNNLKNYYPNILKKSSFLIQNNEGDTALHSLIDYKIWKEYKSIFEKQKLSIFLKNKSGISVQMLILSQPKNKLDFFHNIIVKSYYNQLLNNPNSEFVSKWENNCSIQKLDMNSCIERIENALSKNISYPQKKKNYCINISKKNIKNKLYKGTTDGSSLDVIISILLIKKLTKIKFDTIINSDIINNDTYKNFANDNYLYEDFYNYEIIWNRQNIFFPIGLDKSIQEFLNNKNRYFIISIGINLAERAHANILIFDKLYKSYERYEPHGSRSLSSFYYFPNELDIYIYNYFSKFTDYTYIKPIDGSPAIGFQTYELYESNHVSGYDPGGYCLVWCSWYAYQRISSGLPMKKLMIKLIQKIRGNNMSFKNIIRNYTNLIVDLRNKLLNSIEIKFDEWINIRSTNDDKLIYKVAKEINRLFR